MGRHRKYPTTDGDVVTESAVGDSADKKTPSEAAMRRLGFDNKICQNCNANNAHRANKCRKCGSTELRRKKSEYADA